MLTAKLSSILPQTIYQTESAFSGKITVRQKGRERQLVVGGFVQSINADCPRIERRVWGRIAQLVADSRPSPQKRILILGLGAGTEASLIAKKLPQAKILAVEIDPAIIAVAKRFFRADKIPRLTIKQEDAFAFVAKTREKFAFTICDFYAGGVYPAEADSEQFLARLATCSEQVIFNRIFPSEKSSPAREFVARLRRRFPQVRSVPVRYQALNILYLCGRLGDD